MMIKKTFTQILTAQDSEGRRMAWEDDCKNRGLEWWIDDLRTRQDTFTTGAREVEKTFDPDTFTITVKVLRGAEMRWNRETGRYIAEY